MGKGGGRGKEEGMRGGLAGGRERVVGRERGQGGLKAGIRMECW